MSSWYRTSWAQRQMRQVMATLPAPEPSAPPAPVTTSTLASVVALRARLNCNPTRALPTLEDEARAECQRIQAALNGSEFTRHCVRGWLEGRS